MSAPLIARITGGFLLVFGIAGFAPGISTAAPFEAPVLALDMVYRFVFGMFATNAAHAALDILLGLLAFFAARSFGGAIAWCRVVGWWSVVLVIFGSIPLTDTLFGIAPLYGHDLWLNALVAFVTLFGGHGRASRPELLQPA